LLVTGFAVNGQPGTGNLFSDFFKFEALKALERILGTF